MVVQDLGDRVLVTPGRRLLSRSVDPTREGLVALGQLHAGRTVELDLSRIDQVCAAGLASLIRLHADLQRSGGRLVLVGPDAIFLDLLQLSKLDKVFNIQSDEADPCFVVSGEAVQAQ